MCRALGNAGLIYQPFIIGSAHPVYTNQAPFAGRGACCAEGEGFKPPVPIKSTPDFESSAIDHSANLPKSGAKIVKIPDTRKYLRTKLLFSPFSSRLVLFGVLYIRDIDEQGEVSAKARAIGVVAIAGHVIRIAVSVVFLLETEFPPYRPSQMDEAPEPALQTCDELAPVHAAVDAVKVERHLAAVYRIGEGGAADVILNDEKP